MTQESQLTIAAWAQETFGPIDGNAPVGIIAARMNVEVAELLQAVAHGKPEAIADEIGDCGIMLNRLASVAGVDLQTAIDAKMQINRKRKWKLAGDGTGRHVRDEESESNGTAKGIISGLEDLNSKLDSGEPIKAARVERQPDGTFTHTEVELLPRGRWEVVMLDDGKLVRVRWSVPEPDGRVFYAKSWRTDVPGLANQWAQTLADTLNKAKRKPSDYPEYVDAVPNPASNEQRNGVARHTPEQLDKLVEMVRKS